MSWIVGALVVGAVVASIGWSPSLALAQGAGGGGGGGSCVKQGTVPYVPQMETTPPGPPG
jgi:hypothetical protein